MKFSSFVASAILIATIFALSASAQFGITGTIYGRVVTPSGRGVRRAVVRVVNLDTLESQSRIANDFGYFEFENLSLLNLHMVTVGSKNHEFSTNIQLVQFVGVEHNMTFTSDN